MDSTKLKVIIIFALAIFGALYLGLGLATAQSETVIQVVSVISFLFCLTLGRKIWLLIPFLGAIGFRLSIPGSLMTDDVARILFVGFSIPLILMRRLPFKIQFTELEWWALVISLCVLQAFLSHPVGLNLFASDQVGGKPYVLCVLYLVTGLGLASLRIHPQELKTAMKLGILGGITGLVLGVIGTLAPNIGMWYGVGFENLSDDPRNAPDTGRATRINYLGSFAKNLALWICALKFPLRSLINPFWSLLILVSFSCAAMSGFRTVVAMVAMTYIVGILYRGGLRHLVVVTVMGGLALSLIALFNQVVPLPANVQRALSFLPGTWDERQVDDANSSSEWRFEMWKAALTSEKYIRNKWFGDGLGFSREEIERSEALQEMKAKGISGWDIQRESIMITGNYHSGPVQTIKTVGVTGLILLLAAMIRLAVHAHRQIRRCHGTEWYPVALFFGIPAIYAPIIFVLIFGTFQLAISNLMLGLGMIRMLQNNLPLPIYSPVRRNSHAHLPLHSIANPGHTARARS